MVLVMAVRFKSWSDALAISDATTSTAVQVLDVKVFCYVHMDLPERIHTDHAVQFESQLMTEMCLLWKIDETRTTLCHPQANRVVERNNRIIGDLLRTLLVGRTHEK